MKLNSRFCNQMMIKPLINGQQKLMAPCGLCHDLAILLNDCLSGPFCPAIFGQTHWARPFALVITYDS